MIVTFNYPIEDFVNNTKVLSMHRAESVFNAGQKPVVDSDKLSNEDESFIKKYLKLGSSKIADVISGYTKNLVDDTGELEPFEFDVTHATAEHQIVFRVNMPDTFPTAVIPLMDEAIKDTLENFVLYRTSKFKAIEFQSYYQDYEGSLGSVRSCINRRTTSTRRTLESY